MPDQFDTFIPADRFAAPGTIRVSEAALALARAFGEEMRRLRPDEDWVITFDWADARRVRLKGTNNWEEVGAGLDIGAFDRSDIADGVTQTVDGVEFAVKVPRQVLERTVERLIDRDDRAFSKLTLR